MSVVVRGSARFVTVIALACVFAVGSVTLSAVPMAEAVMPPFAVQRTQLYAPLAYQHADDVFGASVAVDGDVMAVGSPGDAADTGAVYAYRRVGGVWSDPVRIVPPGLAAGDQYGRSVAVDVTSGIERIVIGAPYHHTANPDAGIVYVYKWSGTSWILETPITAGPSSPDDHFGRDVAIDNGYIAVGCSEDDDKALNAGAVWVYRWVSPNWLHDAVMTCPTGSTGHALGGSVDIDATDDLIIVAGAPQAGVDGWLNCGAVCTFDRDTGSWTHHDTLYAPTDRRADGSWFGSDVAISDRRLIVGASGKSNGAAALAGEAYTYTLPMNLWTYEQTLYNPNPSEGDGFGISVEAEKNTFLVGAWYEDGYQGAVYPYTKWYDSTIAWPKLSATATSVTHFGTSVAMSNGTVVGGAQMSSSPDTALCGGAYVFTSRGTITGTVRDGDTGTLLPGKAVTAMPVGAPDESDALAPFSTMTDGSGNYTLAVDAGSWIIQVQDPDSQYKWGYYPDAAGYFAGTPVTVAPSVTTAGIDVNVYRIGAVYRFYRPSSGTHFYTPDVAERNNVRATLGHLYAYEGIAYVTDPATDTNPLQRFYNFKLGSHFYTADLAEAEWVKNNLGHTFSFDGATYGVSLSASPGKRPVYRFYNFRNGSHFFTSDETERATVQNTLGHIYQFEGPAFYIDN